MSGMSRLTGPRGTELAYDYSPGTGPCIVFLPGYRSDMEGTKVVHLQGWARARGLAFLRLDYSGHGQSGGIFEDGCIGEWADDAEAVIRATTTGPVLLVGSSMGGWIGCILARRLSLSGFIGIACAPDFTEDSFWAGFSEAERDQVMRRGGIEVPSAYEDPYIVTRKIIEDGRNHLVLRAPLPMPWPVRLLQGTQDEAVSRATALALLDRIDGPDTRLTLVKDADHRFSDAACLTLLETTVLELLS